MNLIVSLVAVGVLTLIGLVGSQATALQWIVGVILPYLAVLAFLAGFCWRMLGWVKSPVPFRIPTTSGQQKSLPWVKNSPLDNPHTKLGTAVRMALEILCFRSLFRNTQAEIHEGPRVVYGSNKYLWAAALGFHWAFLIIVIRHMRFFIDPVPGCLHGIEYLDGFMQIGVPIIFATDAVIVAAATWLFFRRIVSPQLRYISLPADYFPLLLILGIATTGICMRYFAKVDLASVKALAMGLATFSPAVPAGIGAIFYIHLFLVCALLAYFPFSKLMHMGGVFLSPTRNMANNSRAVRHVNPWNPKVKVHTYAEWEEEFKEQIKIAGLPFDKE